MTSERKAAVRLFLFSLRVAGVTSELSELSGLISNPAVSALQ